MFNLKKIEVMNYEIPFMIKDKGAKDTVIFVHGFNSSYRFIGDLPTYETNYNVISFSFPGSKDVKPQARLSVHLFSKILKNIIEKHAKNSNIHLVGHSLGAISVASNARLEKVKTITYVSPFHPYIQNYSLFKMLKSLVSPKTPLAKIGKGLLKTQITKITELTGSNDTIKTFLDEKSPLFNIVQQDFFDANLFSTLNQGYAKTKDKSSYIIGKKDKIVSSKLFQEYIVNYLEEDIAFIGEGHNPFLEEPYQIVRHLNAKIPFKRRRFAKFKKIIS